MLAGQIKKLGQIKLIDHPEPELVKPGQVIFQPEMACLCGSDSPYFNENQSSYPLPIGMSLHEMVGTIVCSNGGKLSAGQKVLAVPLNHEGIFERMAISEDRVLVFESNRPSEEMVIAQPLGTVLYALRKLPNLLGWKVAVVGQGPIGQLFCAALKNLGASEVIGIDVLASRLETSKLMGASAVIDNSKDNLVQAIQDLTGGDMVDLVIEAAGHQEETLNLCIEICKNQGRLHYFGIAPQTINGVEWLKVVTKSLNITSSHSPDFKIDFPLAIKWINEERIDVRPLITHKLPLNKIQQAFELFSKRLDGALKVCLQFPTSN